MATTRPVKGALRALLLALPHRAPVAAMFVLALLSAAGLMAEPLLMELIVDRLLPAAEPRAGLLTGAGFLGLMGVSAVADLMRSRLGALAGSQTAHELRRRTWARRSGLPLPALERGRAGEPEAFVTSIESVRETLAGTLPWTAHDAAVLALALAAALLLDARVALVVVAGLPPLVVIYRRVMRTRLRAAAGQREALLDVLAHCARWLVPEAVLAARGMAREGALAGEFESLSLRLSGADVRLVTARDRAFLASTLAVAVMRALMVPAAFVFALSPGEFAGLFYLQGRLLDPLTNALERAGSVAEAVAKLEGVLGAEEPPPQTTPGAPPAIVRGHLSFGGVMVETDERRRLARLSLEVRAGERIALVGPSGAGKSTLGLLAAGLLEPTFGAVMLDGRDLRELDGQFVRTCVGYQPQHPYLADASVLENLTMGRGLRLEEVVEAARHASIHDDILALPESYATELGPRGATLAGGQAARLALARTLLSQAPILVLDEPTSALDPVTARAVDEQLGDALSGRTVILITHRLPPPSWIRRVVVLRAGSVVEDGTPELLALRDGPYARLLRQPGSG